MEFRESDRVLTRENLPGSQIRGGEDREFLLQARGDWDSKKSWVPWLVSGGTTNLLGGWFHFF